MADVSKIKLPDGTTYNIKDTVSGYITPSDIADKVNKFNIYRGTEIDDGIYAIDKTQSEIIQAYWGGKYMLFIAAEEDMLYPFLGISGATLIFGYSETYNNTIILEGYTIYQVNDTMVASKLSSITTIPTKVSQLTNDSGFITSYTETDPTVPSWAKASTKPTYTASEVGALSGNSGGVFYGTCSTAAGTVAKVVECADFTADNLKAGTIIIVTFTATNSGAVANLTMNVNGTGAKHIKYINNGTLGNLSSAGYLKANTEYPFYYDGANWVVWMNYNTTYSALSEADMKAGTATASRLISAARLKEAVEYHAPVTSVNGSTGDVTVTVPTKTSELTNDSGFLTSAPVTSVNGQTGAVTINVPTNVSELTNDMGFIEEVALDTYLAYPTFCATDATSKAVLQQMLGVTAKIVVPSGLTSTGALLYKLEPRTWFCWMNGTEMEFARLSVSVNTGTSAVTLYLRGRTSIATGIMGVDSSWTVTPYSSTVEIVRW